MTRNETTTRTIHLLAIAAVIVFAGGSPTLALEAEEPNEEIAAQPLPERAFGGCQCRNRGADDGEPGALRRGRMAGDGGCGMGRGPGRGQRLGAGPQPRMGSGQGEPRVGRDGHRNEMEAIRALVHDHRLDIVREVEDVENGVATVTRAPESPAAVAVLKRHVGEMKALLRDGGPMRAWDPLFREIFEHHGEIEMVVEELDDGVRVIETSANPEVVKLIRAHARKVDEFVARGPAAVHEPTALPEGYLDSE